MARQANNTLFLEDWLRTCGGTNSTSSSSSTTSTSSSSSARAIIQAWAELRDCQQHQSFQPNHLQALKTLLHSQTSLHVAEPQAKLLISILSSQSHSLPLELYPLFLRLLYIWVRKSFKPNAGLVDSALEVLPKILDSDYVKRSPELFAGGVLLLGAFSFVPSASETCKTVCLELLCKLLDEPYRLVGRAQELVPDIFAGIGYALCSSVNSYYTRVMDTLLGIWRREDGPPCNILHGLMVMHLIEWVMFGFIKSHHMEKLQKFAEEILGTQKQNYAPFSLIMAAAGTLRALNRSTPGGQVLDIVSRLRVSAEFQIASLAQDLIMNNNGVHCFESDSKTSLLLQCISVALARCGPVSPRVPLLLSLVSALLKEIFPLQRLYTRILEVPRGCNSKMGPSEVKEHLNSVPFKDAGTITGVLCNQYVAADDESKVVVESLVWRFCEEIYMGHRQVALLLNKKEDDLLRDIEKIAESAFLMVAVFALAVTKQRLNSESLSKSQMDISVSILISFSCLEYFRRMRLPEYLDTIRHVVVRVQESDTACISLIESMPSYADLTSPQDFQQKMDYKWFNDEVQTARMLFYLRVIPTFIERVPGSVFSRVVVPTMFLYIGHPNGKVGRASHSMFVAFISSGKDSDDNERTLLKEQLAFYYLQRSIEGYPGFTPFEGMASGVVSLVRNLPAGSPATFYCIHTLVAKANALCTNAYFPESEPCKKIMELLLRLLSLADIQVLPDLMKLLAQLIIQLPKDGQNAVLNDLYDLVAESDDVTRKPTLVSWLQSVSYLCSQDGIERRRNSTPSGWDGINARL